MMRARACEALNCPSLSTRTIWPRPDLPTEPAILPAPPTPAVSRVDTLPDVVRPAPAAPAGPDRRRHRRALPADRGAGRRRHGPGVRRREPGHRQEGGGQGAQARAPRRRHLPPALSAGGRGDGGHRAPQRGAASSTWWSAIRPSWSWSTCTGPTLSERIRDDKRLEPYEAHPHRRAAVLGARRGAPGGRDPPRLKPANVILCPTPRPGEEPKLIDFGLAKLSEVTAARS